MDLYRYFHPHHNPRLAHKPLRLIEIAELQQAASELKKAIERSQTRTVNAPIGPIREHHFENLVTAIEYIIDSLSVLSDAHPGDSLNTLKNMLEERQSAPGWENWTRLLRHRLSIEDNAPFTSGSPEKEEPIEEIEFSNKLRA